MQSQVSCQCVEIWQPARATWTMQDWDGKGRLGAFTGWDKERKKNADAGCGIEEAACGVKPRLYKRRELPKRLLISIDVRTCSRQKYERKAKQIIRADHANLLLTE